MNRKPIFFIADLHLGHHRSIEFDNRPFRDVDHMQEVIINNFNSTVPDNALTYFQGDLGWNDKYWKEAIRKMKGDKILIQGNHDKVTQEMYDLGFSAVLQGAVIYIAGQKVTLSHYPLLGIRREETSHIPGHESENWYGENKHRNICFKDEGQFHLHGHIHSRKDTPGKSITLGRQYDVGLPANNYRPVSISQIESWISKFKS